jgi:hypothetical protein
MDSKLLNEYLKGDALPHEKEEVLHWIEKKSRKSETVYAVPQIVRFILS